MTPTPEQIARVEQQHDLLDVPLSPDEKVEFRTAVARQDAEAERRRHPEPQLPLPGAE